MFLGGATPVVACSLEDAADAPARFRSRTLRRSRPADGRWSAVSGSCAVAVGLWFQGQSELEWPLLPGWGSRTGVRPAGSVSETSPVSPASWDFCGCCGSTLCPLSVVGFLTAGSVSLAAVGLEVCPDFLFLLEPVLGRACF